MILGRATKRQLNPPGPTETALRRMIRQQGKEDSTADAYWNWCERFIRWISNKNGKWVDPKDVGRPEVEQFLSWLANDQRISANTQNQAFSALCYLYRWVIKIPIENCSALRSKVPDRVREVADQSELVALFRELRGVPLLSARMMYASPFRLNELGNLRMKDISFQRKQITIRAAKGNKDRIVGFPEVLHEAVQRQIDSMKVLWQSDVAEGLNGVSLPDAYGRKCPSAHLDFAWFYLFCADDYRKCPNSGKLFRHHRDMNHVGRMISKAVKKTGCNKHITSHCLRHSYATHSVEDGMPIHVLMELMGHSNIETTETYLHVSKHGATSYKSPLESLLEQPKIASEQRNGQANQPLRLFVG